MTTSTSALHNVRIIDLSRVLAGPYCTQMLGDLGAEVIKIERPHQGDDTRHWGTAFVQNDAAENTTESAYYLSANRNKRSVAIDLNSQEGQTLLKQLIASADILIHNFKAEGLAKYGLEYAQLKAQYPELIYCAISGFGQTGPMAKDPGYDFIAQAMSGLMDCTGEANGSPMKVGVALTDIITGLNAAVGILAALHSRQSTGKGQLIDVSLLDCSIASLSNLAQHFLTSGNTAPRFGNAHPSIVPYQCFATQDNYLIVAVGNDNQFTKLCLALDQAPLSQDPRFTSNQARIKHRQELVGLLTKQLAKHTTEHWLSILKKHNVPCAPVNNMAQVFAMPQVQKRNMQIQMSHSLSQVPIDLVGSPLKLSETPVSYRHAPPTCGQDTDTVLQELLNLDEDTIQRLKNNRIVQ